MQANAVDLLHHYLTPRLVVKGQCEADQFESSYCGLPGKVGLGASAALCWDLRRHFRRSLDTAGALEGML